MDKSSVKEITSLAMAALNANDLHDQDLAIIPSDFKLQSLESFKNTPKHFRGTFKTTVLNEFTAYINLHGDDNTGVYIDQENMYAQAIIDQGATYDPMWGKHRAEIELLKTPAFAALLKFNNASMLQQDFIDIVEDWQSNIEFIDAGFVEGQTVTITRPIHEVIKTLRKLKVNASATKEQTLTNYSSSNSALESIEIKAGDNDLPKGFIFKAAPYESFEDWPFYCQMRAINDEKIITLKYRISQLDTAKEFIANSFREQLKDGITDREKISIFIGRMDYQK